MSHARLSPSSAHRWIACPGSVREEAKYPDSSGDAAIDGTRTHNMLEACLVMDKSPDEFLNETINDEYGSFTVDQERVDRVKEALAYIYARKAEIPGPVAVRAESKVNPGTILLREDITGTADCILVGEHDLEVIDYKDGMVFVDPSENWQMILYTLGVIAEYPNVLFDRIRMTIVQPKNRVRGQAAVNWVDVDGEYLKQKAIELMGYTRATDSPDAPLVAGQYQCKWCKAKGNCSALANTALQEAQVMFQSVEISQQSADKDPNVMSDEKLREVIEAAPLIREFLKSVEEEAFKRMKSGTAIPGLKLVHGRGSRQWNLPEEEMAERLKKMRVPKDVMYPQKLISVAQMEKAKWERKQKGEMVTVSLSEKQLKNMFDNYVDTTKGKLQVALDSDSRSAVVNDAATIFQDVQPATTNSLPDWMQ